MSFRVPLGIVAGMSEPRQPVIVGGARTPIGRLLGALASKSASDLGGVAIAGAVDRAGVRADQVEYVIMGQVLQAGAGQITGRQGAVASHRRAAAAPQGGLLAAETVGVTVPQRGGEQLVVTQDEGIRAGTTA